MVEIFGLGIYSVQWLGIVLGVGAEVVLLCAHLIALHQHRPQWLESIPAVRTAQFAGLVLIVLSGAAAVGYQFLIGAPYLLLLPVFGFKWVLIIVLTIAYFLEKKVMRGRALLEGFTGATWLALFLVHSVAPIAPWLDLAAVYAAWLVVFGILWGAFVMLMKHTGKQSVKIIIPTPPVAVVHKVVPQAPKPIAPPVIKPVIKITPPPPPPKPIPVLAKSISLPTQAGLPVIEPLELMAPHAPVVVKPTPNPNYTPDYEHMPGLRIMPQRPEDMHLQNRAPLIQAA